MSENKNNVEDFHEADLYQDMPVEARAGMLEAQCHRTSLEEIERPYTQDELEAFKDELVDSSVKYAELAAQMKVMQDEFKAKMKPFEVSKTQNILFLRSKVKTTMESVYLLANHHSGKMEVYDAAGVFLSSRKLRPEEKQTNIHQLRDAV
jgi:hypothetical protein